MMETPVATFTDHNVIMIETLVYISITTFIAKSVIVPSLHSTRYNKHNAPLLDAYNFYEHFTTLY